MFQNANGRWRFTKTPFLNKHKAKTPSRTWCVIFLKNCRSAEHE
jgi:hypothetical protein